MIYYKFYMFIDRWFVMLKNTDVNLNNKSLYTYCSAKKIYYNKLIAEHLLFEKLEDVNKKCVSLTSRNIIVTSKINGLILFSTKKEI